MLLIETSKFLTSVVSPGAVYCPSKITLGAVTSPLNVNVVLLASLSVLPERPVTVPVTLPTTFALTVFAFISANLKSLVQILWVWP